MPESHAKFKNLDLLSVRPLHHKEMELKAVEKQRVGTLYTERKGWFCNTCLLKESKFWMKFWRRKSMEEIQLEIWIPMRTSQEDCQDKI